ncbi:MAG: ABC transporter ATP-binding protein [Fusobacteriaceae bacterium]
MFRIKNLNKSYKDFKIENLNLEIAEGEFLTILGESGSGKTTLLKIAGALDENYTGEVLLNGKDIKLALKLGEISMVFQEPLLLNHLNLWENIRFGVRFKKLGKLEEQKRVKEAVKLLELMGLEKKYPFELSGGQKQRVAIARSLVNEPKFILMDEPFSALDPPLRNRLQEKIKEIQIEKNLTVLFITHDRDEAFYISDRIGIMKKGEIVQIDTPKNLYDFPNSVFVANFLGINNIFTKEEAKEILNLDSKLKFEYLALRSEDLRLSQNCVSEENTKKIEVTILDYYFKSGFYEINTELLTGKKIVIKQNKVDFELTKFSKIYIMYCKEDVIYIEIKGEN